MSTSTLTRKLFSASVLHGFALVLSAGAALYTMPLLYHHLGSYTYGLWVMIGTILGYCGFLDLGLSTAVGRSIAKAHADNNPDTGINIVVSNALLLYTILGSVAFFITWLVAYIGSTQFVEVEFATTFYQAMLLLGFTLSIQFPIRSLCGILYSYNRFGYPIYAGIFETTVRLGLIIYCVEHGYGLVALAVINLITTINTCIIEYVGVRITFRKFNPKRSLIGVKHIRELYRYARIAFTASVADFAKLRSVPAIIAGTVGLHALAIYTTASRLLEYVEQLLMQIVYLLTPIFAKIDIAKDKQQADNVLTQATVCISIIMSYIYGSCLIYGETFFYVWMGPEFRDSSTILATIGIASFVYLTLMPIRQFFYGISLHHYCAITSWIQVIVIMGSCLFVGKYGLVSISQAVTAGVVIPELLLFFWLGKILSVKTVVGMIIKMISVIIKMALVFIPFYLIMHNHMESTYTSLIMWNAIQIAIILPYIVVFVCPANVCVALLGNRFKPSFVTRG